MTRREARIREGSHGNNANQDERCWNAPSTPLFPFGHGLSYSRFDYRDLAVDQQSIAAGNTVTVSATVTNVGDRAADEVVQLYIHQRHGSASRKSGRAML